jgi:XTP/dITP diphosphohydrolase
MADIRIAPGPLVIASHNEGKVREIRELLAPFGFDVKSAGELGLDDPEETGTTFEENAVLKAEAACRASSLPALADDSGLSVDALGGDPGIYSARWAPVGDDGKRDFAMAMRNVEEKLQASGAVNAQDRGAQFVCVLALARPGMETVTFTGIVRGTMVWPPRGDKGFGYDPAFLPEGHETTFGEMSAEEKHGWSQGAGGGLSHRARAFALFAEACLLGSGSDNPADEPPTDR